MGRSNDYLYIRRYGRLIGSYDYYIQDQVEQARADNAPATAYCQSEDGWKTVDGIVSDVLRRNMGLNPLPTSKLPATYTVTIGVDLTRSDSSVVVAVERHGRQIYHDRFDTYAEGARRAEMEIGFDFARAKD